MGPLFGLSGFVGIIVSLILLTIYAIRKKSKDKVMVALAISIGLFISGMILTPSSKDKENQSRAGISNNTTEVVVAETEENSSEYITETEALSEISYEENIEEIVTEEDLSDRTNPVINDLNEDLVEENTIKEVIMEDDTTEEITTEAPTTEEIATEEKVTEASTTEEEKIEYDYILNTNTRKFHYPSCKSVMQMKDKNKKEYHGTREDVIGMGYDPCGNCKP